MKKLENYKIIKTDDGSLSLFSNKFNETCHSHSGALEETLLHYVGGCKVLESYTLHNLINIFEVGFGTGLGFQSTIEELKHKTQQKGPIHFVSTEIDPDLVQYFFEQNNLSYIYNKELDYYKYQEGDVTLIILIGDARKSVDKLTQIFNSKFHCIYQDAFSPKRNSILWTTQWFEQLKNIAHKDCIMSTYSSSSSVRKSMIDAGWTIYNGAEFGKKRTSTRATLTGTTSQEILDRLKRSPVEAITDDNYKTYTIEITHEKNKDL